MALCGIPKTFKQQVAEIECSQCNNHPKGADCPVRDNCLYGTNRVNAILAAHNAELDRIARGMQPLARKFKRNSNCWGYDFSDEYEAGAEKQLDECQAHVRAQKEGM